MAGLIINSPYTCPDRHLEAATDGRFQVVPRRRPAGYEIVDTRNNTKRVEPLELVNRIRERVDAWRDAGYPGVTSITRRLLEHWHDEGAREYPFFFCQMEAAETQIWWVEAPAEHKQGIQIPGDGGDWPRYCNKMATGAGKTIVMAMLITWQVLNAIQYPRRNKDFSQAVLVVAPGITVKERLAVLQPGHDDNIYDSFSLCPNDTLRQKLNRMAILVENWHSLMPLKQPARSVVKKGAESDEAFTRRVLGKLASYKDILVINDEAHHAYRVAADVKVSKKELEERGEQADEATRWIEGLDRIHRTRRIQRCFDLSATPFAPTGKSNAEKGLFGWIISDFGLNDAIEAGLVKTPRIVVRDDALPDTQTYRSKLYHIYRQDEVHEDLNRRAEGHEPLPTLVQNAYTLLGADWRETLKAWRESGYPSPPLMLTVCNRIETARRLEYYFDQGDAHWDELKAPERTLRVDSKVLEKAEIGETAGTDKDYEERLRGIVQAADIPETRKTKLLGLKKEELLREIIDNVGKQGTAGQELQNVISVAMLSEGWDAKNVTHIMGLRAFTSQLLCEQVIGRGLRRVSFDMEDETGEDGVTRRLFRPEYVNVFGVPLSIFETEDSGEAPPPPKPSYTVESLPERNLLAIRWPNVLRVETVVKPTLVVDWDAVEPITLDPAKTIVSAELGPALGDAADLGQVTEIDLEKLPESFRLQRILFRTAQKTMMAMQEQYRGNIAYLVAQLVRLAEEYLASDKVIIPSLYHQDPLRRRILFALNIDALVQRLLRAVSEQNRERLEPIFDEERPIGSTADMRPWYTTEPNMQTTKSQVSRVVGDSSWEQYAANVMEKNDLVEAYVKNERLGFQVYYMWKGSRRRYVPDFIVRFKSGRMLALEIKGQDSEQNRAKRAAMKEWCDAVNAKGGFGHWSSDVVFEPAKVHDVLRSHGLAEKVCE